MRESETNCTGFFLSHVVYSFNSHRFNIPPFDVNSALKTSVSTVKIFSEPEANGAKYFPNFITAAELEIKLSESPIDVKVFADICGDVAFTESAVVTCLCVCCCCGSGALKYIHAINITAMSTKPIVDCLSKGIYNLKCKKGTGVLSIET